MSNITDYNYSNIEEPYDSLLNKVAGSSNTDANVELRTVTGGEMYSGQSQEEKSIDGSSLKDLWLNSFMKSINYKPLSTGFMLDGKTGRIDARSLRVYDVTVDQDGNGDYTKLEDALAAGYERILLRSGNYKISQDLTLYDNLLIVGEDKYSTIIDFDDGDYQIKAVGDIPYITGTITATNNSNIITGSGTTWTTNLATSDYIVIEDNVYKITAINSNTEIETEIEYQGKTTSGLSYEAGTFKYNIDIRNLTITGQGTLTAPTGVIYFYGVVNSNIDNIIITNNHLSHSRGIWTKYTHDSNFTNIDASNNGHQGIIIDRSHGNIFDNINVSNNNYVGFYIYYSDRNIFSNIDANCNGQTGITIASSSYNILTNIKSNYNNSYGMQITGLSASNTKHNLLSTIECNNNGAHGIYLKEYGKNNIISTLTCNFNSNTGVTILENGEKNTINNIQCYDNTSQQGIKISGDNNSIIGGLVCENGSSGIWIYKAKHNIIEGVDIRDNSQLSNGGYKEISIQGVSGDESTYNIITGNNIQSTLATKAGYGIREDVSYSDYNIITNNVVLGAVTANISLNGANTEEGHNQDA